MQRLRDSSVKASSQGFMPCHLYPPESNSYLLLPSLSSFSVNDFLLHKAVCNGSSFLESVRKQNVPHLNVSLSCGLFQAEDSQASKDSGRTFNLPSNRLKQCR